MSADPQVTTRIALIGDATIAGHCLRRLRASGFEVVACLPGSLSFAAEARSQDVPVLAVNAHLDELLETPCDWILSAFNIRILPEKVIAHPSRGVINFHDGPLPRYAGLYAPTRALLDGKTEHGVTWHLVDSGIDTGDVLVSESVSIDPLDTSLSLQLRCLQAGCRSFDRLVPLLHEKRIDGQPQDASQRTVFGNREWSRRGLETDWLAPCSSTLRVVRAHHFGPYANYVGRPRFRVDGRWHALTEADSCADSNCSNVDAAPGTTCIDDHGRLHVRCGDRCLVVMSSDPPVSDETTSPVEVRTPKELEAIETWDRARFRHEIKWRRRLSLLAPKKVTVGGPRESRTLTLGSRDEDLACGMLAHHGIHGGASIEFALQWRRAELEADLESCMNPSFLELLHPLAPVRLSLSPETSCVEAVHGLVEAMGDARRKGPFLCDLLNRVGLGEESSCDPADLPVRVLEDGVEGSVDSEWMFTRNPQGAWMVTGPRAVMDWYADLLMQRRRVLIEEPTMEMSALPRVWGATAALVESWEGSTSIPTPAPFLESIAARLNRSDPGMTSVESTVDGGATDQELAAMIEAWAEVLQEAGIGEGDLVPVRLDRATTFVAVMFAVLGLGASFVPIDPLAPQARILQMLEVLDARVGIADPTAEDLGGIRWITAAPKCPRSPGFLGRVTRPDPDRVAFILFTSGSTGHPKGVRLTHRNMDQYLETVVEGIHPEAFLRSAWTSSVGFDSSIAEVLYPLVNQGTVVVFEPGDLTSVPAFVDACRFKKITGIGCATALWSAWMKYETSTENLIPQSIRHVDIGGSVADPELVRTWLRFASPEQCLMNRYGPTETTVTVTAHRICLESCVSDEIPIGRPERGTEIRILDPEGRRIAPGQEGELWIAGGQVALGYLGEQLPENGFQSLPGDENHWYRTGDRATWRDDGEILFRGRADDQVKVGGYRVELGEIGIAIDALANGRETAVLSLVTKIGRELAVLVEWGESSDDGSQVTDQETWRSEIECALDSRLPRYAIPRRWRFVAALPRTASGKVDRTIASKLLAVEDDAHQTAHPTGSRAWILAEVEKVIGRRGIDPSQSFFELGGDSLSAMGLHAALEAAGDCLIPTTLVHVSRNIDDLVDRYHEAARRGSVPIVSTGHQCGSMIEKVGAPEVMFMPGIHGQATLRHVWAPLGDAMSVSAIDLDLDQCRATLAGSKAVGGFETLIQELAEIVLSRSHEKLPIMIGYSIGGWIAFGIASECLRQGIRLPTPILIEPEFHVSLSGMNRVRQHAAVAVDSMINLDPVRSVVRRARMSSEKKTLPDTQDPRGRLPDEVDFEFEELLVKSLRSHEPHPADLALRLVTRRSRVRRFTGWSRLARGGVRHELVDLHLHADFFRYGSEPALVEIIQRHVRSCDTMDVSQI